MGQTNEEFDPELNELQFYWDKADTLGIVKIALDEGKPAAALYLAHYLVEEQQFFFGRLHTEKC